MEKVKKALDRIFIEGLSAMAHGLFATLIIGTIIQQIGTFMGGNIGPGMQELSDNMTALFVGNRPRKKPEKYRFHRCFPAVKRYVIGEAGFCPVFTHVFDAAPAHFHGASPPHPGSGAPAPATGENPVPGSHTPPYAPAWRPRCSRNDRSTAARHP